MDSDQYSPYQLDLIDLEKRMNEALTKQDALSYYALCNEFGADPTDQELYSLGMACAKHNENTESSELERLARLEISQFLKDACRLNPGDFSANTRLKSQLLANYFPRRFGTGGKQDIEARRYSAMQIGALFSRVVSSYKRKN